MMVLSVVPSSPIVSDGLHGSNESPNGRPAGRLSGRRIVVTRPRAGSAKLRTGLEALGADVIVCPAIAIAAEDGAVLDAALRDAARYRWIAFTSANAVACALDGGPSASRRAQLAQAPIAAVGAETGAALAARGLRASFVPSTASGEALGRELPVAAGDRVLLARAADGRGELSDGLRERGALVDDVGVYRTVVDPSLAESVRRLAHDGFDAAAFASPSAVRHFVDAYRSATEGAAPFPLPPSVAVVCIGPTTAAAARDLGLVVDAVADEQNEESMVSAVVRAMARRPETGMPVPPG